MHKRHRVSKSAVAGTLAFAVASAFCGSARAQADAPAFEVVNGFRIEAQPLARALLEFSSQADIVVVASPELVDGKQAPAVLGVMTRGEALKRLLAGTGLSYKAGANGGVMIVRAPPQTGAARSRPSARLVSSATDDNVSTGFTLEEVTVTAQKRVENIQEVPSSITVIDAALLRNISAKQLTDYAGYIPGFTVQSAGIPGAARLTLRGIASSSSATVGTYIDEVPLGSSTSFGDRGSLSVDLVPYDVAGVEVFRGPQGTLYGANAMGGILKYTTRAPQLNGFDASFGADVSSVKGGDSGWSARASVSVPLVEDRLAVRASASYQETPGFVDNALTGAKDENGGDVKGGRLVWLWAPHEDVTVQLATLRQETTNGIGTGIVFDEALGRPVYGDLRSYHTQDLPSGYEQTLELHTATISWDLGPAELISATGYSNTDTLTITDASAQFRPVLGALVGIDTLNELKKLTQEIRLVSDAGGRFEWLAGAFYISEDYNFRQTGRALSETGEPAPGLNPLLDAILPSTYRELALFANATYRFSDSFDINAGLRWTHNRQSFHQTNVGFLFNPADPTSSITDGARASDEIVNYMISPRLHVGESTMLYARVASGYRPGGPNVAFPGAEPTYDADTLTNYEVGIKSEFWDDRALVNLSIFHIDWQDVQVVGQTPTFIPFIVNAGDATSEGVELSTAFQVLDGFRISLNAAFTDSTVDDEMPALNARKGERLPNVARWSGSITADYERPLGSLTGVISAGYQYTGDRDSRFAGDPRNVRMDAYGIIDLSASLSNDRWTARLYVRNLADERAYVSPTRVSPTVFESAVTRPRTIGVSIDFAY